MTVVATSAPPSRAVVTACWLTAALATASQSAAVLTFAVPGLLTGTDVMNGSARGTALVVAIAGVPAMVLGAIVAVYRSTRGAVVWIGAAMYLAYNAVMFLFATPVNELFLVYVAMLALSIWTIGVVLRSTDARLDLPSRRLRIGIAIYMGVTIALSAFVWIRDIVGALDEPAELTTGTGLTTNPVYIQDLAVWLPLATITVIGMWLRRRRWTLLAGAFLTLWVLESISIAVDQAFGHHADPGSSVASADLGWSFASLAVIGLIPLVAYFRGLASRPGD